jgi:hypothetical protein
MIKCKISQIGKANPADFSGSCFNVQRKEFSSMEDALAWLERDYGISKPARIHEGNSVYEDREGGGAELVGFLNRRWVQNYDRRHDEPRNYWQENWVTFSQFEKRPLNLKQALA